MAGPSAGPTRRLVLAIRRAGLALTDRALLSGLAALVVWLVLVLLSPQISQGNALPAGAVGAGLAVIVLAAARYVPTGPRPGHGGPSCGVAV